MCVHLNSFWCSLCVLKGILVGVHVCEANICVSLCAASLSRLEKKWEVLVSDKLPITPTLI